MKAVQLVLERVVERRVRPDARAVNEILDDLDRFAAPTRTVIEWP
ncbi:MAG TPA: hypothetical protein VH163_01905 [Gemmatimonadales bacterium]|nr:hypothetical protein [Gemmatimonadales bacterium]